MHAWPIFFKQQLMIFGAFPLYTINRIYKLYRAYILVILPVILNSAHDLYTYITFYTTQLLIL